MKRLLFLSAIALGTLCTYGQSLSDDYVPVQNEKGKWGYQTSSGTKVIDFKYDAAEPFSEGRAKVRKGNKYGIINPEGKFVLPIQFDDITEWAESTYRVAKGGKWKDGVLSNEKYGLADVSGKIVVKPEYEELAMLTGGVAAARKGKKYGFISDRLQWVVPVEYEAVGSFNEQGLVWVNKGCKLDGATVNGGKYGVFDSKGNNIVPVKYSSLGTFYKWKKVYTNKELEKFKGNLRYLHSEGGSHHLLARKDIDNELYSPLVMTDYGEIYASTSANGSGNGVWTSEGTMVVAPGAYKHAYGVSDGMVLVQTKGGNYNYVDVTSGRLISNRGFKDAWNFRNGVAVIQENEGYYLIDKSGEKITTGYDYISPARNEVHIVKKGDKYGAISSSGQPILMAEYDAVRPISEDRILVKAKNGLYGFADKTGKMVIKPTYKSAASFRHGWASVCDANGNWGDIDPDGKVMVPLKWDNTIVRSERNPQFMWVKKKDDPLFYCYNIKDGKIQFNNGYRGVRNFNTDYKGVAFVNKSNTSWGVVNDKGEEIVPVEMPSWNDANEAYRYMLDMGKSRWTKCDTFRASLRKNNARNQNRLTDLIQEGLWDY